MARWLKSAGYPAVRLVDVDQPVATDRHVAVVSPIVLVVVGSLTIASPVVFYLIGGHRTKMQLDSAKDWLAVHNDDGAVPRPRREPHC